jgi:5-formyltetrahydrofolate cyclo-ligase
VDDDLLAAKALLRRRLGAVRQAIPDAERTRSSRLVIGRLLSVPELAGRGTVAAFAPLGTEVAVEGALATLIARGWRLALPRVEGDDVALGRVRSLDALVPGWRGVREPAPDADPVDPGELDVAIVPGLAFDRRGARLGYGGGHLDRLLARRRPGAPVIAVAFGVQLVDRVPVEAHDVRIDVIVTEDEVIRPAAPG